MFNFSRLSWNIGRWWNRAQRAMFSWIPSFGGARYWIGWFFFSMWRGILYPFATIGWMIRQVFMLFGLWWQSRNFRYLVQGLPALVAMAGVFAVATYSYLRAEEGLIDRYRRAGDIALRSSDSQKALLCYERLYQIDKKRQEFRFGLAMILRTLPGQRTRSDILLQDLANPSEAGGYPRAHVMLAEDLFKTVPMKKDVREGLEVLNRVETHLRRALDQEKDNIGANFLMARLLLATSTA